MKNYKRILTLGGFFIAVIGILTLLPKPALAQNVTMTGVILKPDLITPVTSGQIAIHNASWSYTNWSATDTDGSFDFYDVPAGSYTVDVYAYDSTYEDPEPFDFYYNGSGIYDFGTILLQEPSVQITLKKSDNTTPVTNYQVCLHDASYAFYNCRLTNDSGVASFGISTYGTYTAEMWDKYEGESPPNSFTLTYSGTQVAVAKVFKAANVTGTLKKPDGTACTSTECSISFFDSSWAHYYYASPDVNGLFSLNIDYTATYKYRVDYWGQDAYSAPEETSVAINGGANNNLGDISLLTPNITGKLVDSEGNGIPNVSVTFHSANWMYNRNDTTGADGTFGFSLSTNGTYYVDFWVDSWTYPDYAAPATQTVTYAGAAVGLGNIEIGIPAMKIKVVDSSGNPQISANVDVHDPSWSMNGSYWGSTNDSGVGVVNKSLATGTYLVRVSPPWSAQGLLPSEEIQVDLTAGVTNTYYVTHPIVLNAAVKTVSGTVKYPDGTPVTDASIDTWAMGGNYGGFAHTQTDTDGNYTLLVGQGQYQVNIWPAWTGTSAPDWGSPGPQSVEFNEANDVAESQDLDFTVAKFNATITGTIVKPDGTEPGAAINLSVNAWEKGGYMGNNVQAESDGSFSIKIAGGHTYDVNIWAWNNGMGGTEYGGPSINPVKVGDQATVDLGTVYLVEKTATITGKVTDTNGQALANQSVNAWSINSTGWGDTMTDEEGNYSMAIFPGTYMVNASEGGASTAAGGASDEGGASYVAIEPPQQVTTLANATTPNINFQLGIADATIKGHLEDADGNLISGVWGWVNASNSLDQFTQGDMWFGGTLGGPLNGGQFEMNVPAGKYTLSVFMDWNAEYTQEADVTVEIGSGETTDDVVITMLPNTAVIEGRFVDSEGNPVNNVWGEVYAKRPEGGSAFAQIMPDGSYSLGVSAGTWNLNYRVDPNMGSAYLPTSLEETSVSVAEDETINLDFTLLEVDSVISGAVQDEDGQAIEGAHVFASLDYAGYERDATYDYYGFNSMEAISAADGTYTINVPEGEYYLSASLPPSLGYIFTGAQLVYTSPDDPAENSAIVFNTADSQITGEVTLDGEGSEAFVYAYTDTGGYSETTTSDGSYTLPVTSGATWSVGAVHESGVSYYLSDQAEVAVADENGAEQDLVLVYQGEMPDPLSVNFDATVAKTITLSDGFKLEIPARALATEGNVTVTVEPTAEVPYQAGAQPLAGYGYNLEARDSQGSLISTFNSEVTLTLPYDEEVVGEIGLLETDLSGEYYNTTSGVWQESNSYMIDKENNTITLTTDHFSAYSTTAPGKSRIAADDNGDGLTVNISSPADNAVVGVDSVLVSGTVSDASAAVTIRLNGVSAGDVEVDAAGAFSMSISGLQDGANTVIVNAVLGLSSASVRRTVVYTGFGDATIDSVTNIPYDIMVMTDQNSSPQIRVFNPDGTLVSQFFAYSQSYRGEFRAITADIDGDGEMEIIVYPYGDGYGPQVRIFEKDGTFVAQKMIFDEGFRRGIEVVDNVDLDQDGQQDFVVVPRGESGPNLRAYKYNIHTKDIELLAWTMVYDESYRGEINLATADVTGDGITDIIVSPDKGGPNVRVYHYNSNTQTLELDGWFMAYQETFRGGVMVEIGDVNGDGLKDIITYPQENGGANIRAYTYNSAISGFELIDWIMPYENSYRGSLSVKVYDLDKDGQAEIITAPATNGGPNLRVYSYNSATAKFELKDWEMVYDSKFRGGIGLTISNLDSDAFREVVVYPLENGGPNVRVYEYDAQGQLNLLDWTFAYAENYRGKISVSVADLDGNGASSLIVSPLSGGGPNLRIYDVTDGQLTLTNWFMAYGQSFRGGVLTKFIN
ncbi:MAG: carboxypeptidase regulatory-like domain-containing protein [Patescibacteria group bacterium]|jgi:protocatechuate 3,4-dioxygenase beta subunit